LIRFPLGFNTSLLINHSLQTSLFATSRSSQVIFLLSMMHFLVSEFVCDYDTEVDYFFVYFEYIISLSFFSLLLEWKKRLMIFATTTLTLQID